MDNTPGNHKSITRVITVFTLTESILNNITHTKKVVCEFWLEFCILLIKHLEKSIWEEIAS